MKKRYYGIMFLLIIGLVHLITTNKDIAVMIRGVFTRNVGNKKIVVVIDPGHGGWDPGKVGVNHAIEKEVNLSISFKLKALLEQNDITVIMTRTEDTGLYGETDYNKKKSDLNKRIAIIHENNADFAISIHQNSFTQEYVKGSQVFYHTKSEEGKILAGLIQEQLKVTIDDGNHRVIKPNNDYYLLRNSNCPLVIVECGYLSNQKEAGLLIDEDYQEKLAWGIHLGIMQYINQEENLN